MFVQKSLKNLFILFVAIINASTLMSTPNPSLKPVLPLQGNVRDLPLLWEAMLEPAGFGDVSQSIKEVKTLKKNLDGKDKVLSRKKSSSFEERMSFLKDVYRMIGYYDRSRFERSDAQKILKKELRRYGKLAGRFAESSDQESHKNIFKYHSILARYMALGYSDDEVRKLLKLMEKVPEPYRLRIELLSNIHLTFSSYTLAQGILDLKKLSTKLKNTSKFTCELALARGLAGIDLRGERIEKPAQNYFRYLSLALNRTRKLGAEARNMAADFSYGVWKKVDSSSALAQAPFLVRFLETLTDAAIKEREVLAQVARGEIDFGIKFYRSLVKSFARDPNAVNFLKRGLELELIKYQKTKEAQGYYQALIDADDFLTKESRYHKKHVKNLEQFTRNKKTNLIGDHLRIASGSQSTKPLRREAIRLANIEIEKLKGKNIKRASLNKLKMQLAQVYTIEKQYHKAEAILSDLSSKGKPNVKALLDLAKSQRLLAGWPEAPPWNIMPKTSSDLRRKLLETYTSLAKELKKAKLSDKLHWHVNGHLILLQLSFGDRNSAVATYDQAVSKQHASKQASMAAVTLIQNLYKDKVWKPLYRVLIGAERFKLNLASIGDKKLNHIWRDVSYRLASKARSKKVKISFLNRYLKHEDLVQDKRSAEVYSQLAAAYESMKKPKVALKVMEKFLSVHKKDKARSNFLLQGHSLAFKYKLDEEAAAFGLTYLKENKSKQVPAVRRSLIKVMERQKSYRMMAKLNEDHANDDRVKADERSQAARKALTIYEKLKNTKRASKLAAMIMKTVPNNPKMVSVAVGYFARQPDALKSRKRLEELANSIVRFNDKVKEVAETRGFIQFSIAKLSLPRKPRLLRGNPSKSLAKLMEQYGKVWRGYDRICLGALNPYCGPAKFRLALYTEKVIESIDGMPLPNSLTQRDMNAINSSRDRHISRLKGLLDQSLNVAYRLAKEGNTPVSWKKLIIEGHDRYRGTGIIAR